MGRGRRGAYKAEKRRKELKRIKKQDEKRKRRLAASKAGEGEGNGELAPGEQQLDSHADPVADAAGDDESGGEEETETAESP